MNPLVANVNGCSILVTRFFKPLKPPKELFEANIEEKEKAENIAWFVANIPYIPKNAIFPGLQVRYRLFLPTECQSAFLSRIFGPTAANF